MRILLVQPYFNTGKRLPETPSRALLILGTLAKKLGHEVKIAHHDTEEIDWNWHPNIVGVTVNTFQVKDAREIVSMAKNRGAKVIVGGPHAVAWDYKKGLPVAYLRFDEASGTTAYDDSDNTFDGVISWLL